MSQATARLRPLLAITGAAAGFAYFLLVEEELLRGASVHLHRAVVYFTIAVFPAFGLAAGPLPPLRALRTALGLAVLSAVLAVWAGTRFPSVGERLSSALEPTGNGLILGPFLALILLAIPVLIAAGRVPGGWRNYRVVLPQAWAAAMKTVITLLFLGLFWAVYFLSDTLLSLVGIRILDDFVDWDPGAYLLSGGVVGIALAVTCELERIVQTVLQLFLRLLRLLLIPVTAVLVLFVAATLFQGLDRVFARTSAAATMMAMAAGSVLLIAAALPFHDEEGEARPHVLTALALRLMGIALPLVAGIALYAIWLRVDAYGWTPERLLAVLSAIIVVLFTLPVTLNAVAARTGWEARVLGGFVWALIATLGLGALWYTPALNAQALAAKSQLERLRAGPIDPASYGFWPLAREWGHPGRAALAAYKADDLSEAVRARITLAETVERAWQAERQSRALSLQARWDLLRTDIQRRPAERALPAAAEVAEGFFLGMQMRRVVSSCHEPRDDTTCAAISGDFLTARPGAEWMLLVQQGSASDVWARVLYTDDAGQWGAKSVDVARASATVAEAEAPDLAEVLSAPEPFEITAPNIQGLSMGPWRIMPLSEGLE